MWREEAWEESLASSEATSSEGVAKGVRGGECDLRAERRGGGIGVVGEKLVKDVEKTVGGEKGRLDGSLRGVGGVRVDIAKR